MLLNATISPNGWVNLSLTTQLKSLLEKQFLLCVSICFVWYVSTFHHHKVLSHQLYGVWQRHFVWKCIKWASLEGTFALEMCHLLPKNSYFLLFNFAYNCVLLIFITISLLSILNDPYFTDIFAIVLWWVFKFQIAPDKDKLSTSSTTNTGKNAWNKQKTVKTS